MDHADLYLLRETYLRKNILLCFNGPFSQGLIEEIGIALRNHLHGLSAKTDEHTSSPSAAMDVFAVYIELSQNIQHYTREHGYADWDASATVVIGRDADGRYEVSAGNIVEPTDGHALASRVHALAAMDKSQLRAAYKEQLRKPHDSTSGSAGLGLIDIARKASAPISCELQPVNSGARLFFSLRVVI
jgi:hypothetical protein